jgi:hypothetical protein
MNVAAGFDTGFSFFYAAPFFSGSVDVYDGLNGTGTLLASLFLPINGAGSGDPNGQYSNWTPIGVAFSGTAKSVNFGGTANYIVFDNITLGSETPGTGDVPEASTLLIWSVLGAVSAIVGIRQRRKTVA